MGGVGCHSSNYELFISITTYNVSSSFNEDWRQIQCNFSITGNMKDKLPATWWYYESNITASAFSNNGLLEISGSPVYFYMKSPGFNGTANFTARGIGNGSESIRFEVKMAPWHKTLTCTRTEIVNVPTNVKINVPPVITDGFVTPIAGSLKMKYTYEINYTDADGDPPGSIMCNINGDTHNMTVKDGTEDEILTGETYQLELLGSEIGMGSDHYYYFIANDGKHDAIGDTMVQYGPTINKADSAPKCQITYPLDGIHSGDLNVTGTAFDLDEGEDIQLVELALNNDSWLPTNGTNSWFISLDLFKWNDGIFRIKARSFNGEIYSNIAKRIITIDNSFSNSAPKLDFQISNDTIVGPYDWINGTLFDPELPDQEIKVYAGLSSPPTLPANVSKNGQQWVWSIRMILSELEEGDFDLFALARDPYVESNVKKISLILDKPNLLPKLDVDELPKPLWGTQDITGTIVDEDNHEIDLNINVSFDNIIWYPTNITGGIWKIRFNFSYFEERDYTFYVKATDLEAEINIELPITVLGPFEKPIFLDILPISPVVVNVDENLTFTVFYRARDHRGTNVQWLVDSIEVFGSDEDNITELDINFSNIGDHEVTIIVSNAEDKDLFSIHSWLVDVKAVLKLEPLSETLINSIVGEAIILQFGVVKGDVKDVSWTVNGNPVEGNGGDEYIYYVPESDGIHTVKVTIGDDYGNVGFIEYTIEASNPPGSEKTNESEEKGQDSNKEIKKTGRFIIAGVGIFLIIVIIISILLITLAIRKSRKSKVQDQGRVSIPKPTNVMNQYPEQKVQVTTPQIPKTSSQQTFLQPQQQPVAAPTPAQVPTIQKADQVYQPPEYQPAQQFQQLQQQHSATHTPVQQPIQQPSFTPAYNCPYCNQPTQYYPDQNGNWCSYCQKYV
jgi:hypothetical protein